MYGVGASEHDEAEALAIRDVWAALRVEVETVDDGLGETREHFTEVTKKQVIRFQEECGEMLDPVP